jgi:hypothetical protein
MVDQVKNILLLVRQTFRRWRFRSFLKTFFDSYHPEQHYMRGPGPKSRALDLKRDVDSKRG